MSQDALIQKLQRLSPDRIRQVEDFVDPNLRPSQSSRRPEVPPTGRCTLPEGELGISIAHQRAERPIADRCRDVKGRESHCLPCTQVQRERFAGGR
jgi:hypothetical protein